MEHLLLLIINMYNPMDLYNLMKINRALGWKIMKSGYFEQSSLQGYSYVF